MGNRDDLFAGDGSENVPDERPGPMFAGPDRYFDEPEREDRAAGLVGWAAEAQKPQRNGLLAFAKWCAEAGDGERRAIMVLLGHFQGRTPKGAIEETARLAKVTTKTVQRAIRRFSRYFPGAVSTVRGRTDTGRDRDRAGNGKGAGRGGDHAG